MTTATYHDNWASAGFISELDFQAKPSTSAFSSQAQKILAFLADNRDEINSSSVTRHAQFADESTKIQNAVYTAYIQCKTANWDGYGAKAVSKKTLNKALIFANKFLNDLALAEIAAEPDGDLAFEWFGSNGNILSISINSEGLLTFAGSFGNCNKITGVKELARTDSSFIRNLLKEME